jgi:hypothetical protein
MEINRDLLLTAIKACGGDPTNLPDERGRGKSGFRAKVRKHLGNALSRPTFDSTWKRHQKDTKAAAAAKK